ncbi:DUF5825 family protein, partial [Streptomyces sp. NPDC057909]|uniref:DUF5825 family protein n=1 Tax=Streptomyces sp. NPDC057909 TaxID=3346277 RepID=UPI0036E889A2
CGSLRGPPMIHSTATTPLGDGPATVHWDTPPELHELIRLDSPAHHAHGIAAVHISAPIPLAGDACYAIHFLRFLQHASTTGIAVTWTAATLPDIDPSLLSHLQPPQPPRPGHPTAPAVTQWRETYRYGACYYRAGPDFYRIRDARDPHRIARLTLAQPLAVAGFSTLCRPTRADRQASGTQRLATDLLSRRLLLTVDEWQLALPYRMRHWPIPYYSA